jgi:hypothetical protein
MADDAGREGAGDGDGQGADPDEPGRAEDDRSRAPSTDTRAGTLAIALISSAAALLGACVGLAGSYLATTLQVGSQEYLQHRNDLRGSCSAVVATAFQMDTTFRLATFREGEPGLGPDLGDALQALTNTLSQQHSVLLLDASTPTVDAGRAVLEDANAISAVIFNSRSSVVISNIDPDPKDRARVLLQRRQALTGPVRQLAVDREKLAGECRREIETP